MKKTTFVIALMMLSLTSFGQLDVDYNYLRQQQKEIANSIMPELEAQIRAQVMKDLEKQRQNQGQIQTVQGSSQTAQQRILQDFNNRISAEGQQRMEYYNTPDNYIDRSITNRGSSYSNQGGSYRSQNQPRDLRTQQIHSESLNSKSLQMLREANREQFSNDDNERTIDPNAQVPLFEAPTLDYRGFGNPDINNVQQYMDNSEPLTKAYLDNIQKLEMLLETQFELVSGFNIAEIRNKPVEERTDAEEQALADYEAYRVKEMEQMNRDIKKQIDNSPEKKEIDAAILANDVYGDDREGNIYQTNFEKLDLKSLSTTNNPLKYVADHIDRCNNIDGTRFHAEMYYNEVTDTYVISIEGSKDSDDWVFNNARNAVNADVPQYILAKQIGDVINSIPQSEREKLNLEIVGHSLGGGVASVIGLTTGLETKTFNASRVPNNFLEENGLLEKVTNNDVQNITAYHTSNDILTNIQQSMGSPAIGISRDIGSTGGVTETVIRGSGVVGTAVDGIAGHKMSSVVNIISNSNNEKKKAEWDKLRKAQYQLQRKLRSAEMKKLL